jgi:hypothetical protein
MAGRSSGAAIACSRWSSMAWDGHGQGAADAAREAERVFRASRELEALAVLQIVHDALRHTRGAAAAVAEVDAARHVVHYAAVGNIAARLITSESTRSLVSLSGIVGGAVRKMQLFSYELPPRALLVMHSDGIGTQWEFAKYQGLTARDPALIAGVLYRDFVRGSDDATVLVVPTGGGPG